MQNIIHGIVTFIIIYLLYEILIINRKNKQDNIYKSTEVTILNKILKVNTNKIKNKVLTRIIACVNAIIVSITLEIVIISSDSLFLQMILGFGVLILLIIIIYPLLALILRKKYGRS